MMITTFLNIETQHDQPIKEGTISIDHDIVVPDR